MTEARAPATPGHLVMVGANQQSAPVAVRERLAVPPAALPDALAQLRAVAAEVLILSTCNRVEVYAMVPGGAPDALRVLLLHQHRERV